LKRKLLDFIRQIWKIKPLETLLLKVTINQPFGSFASKLPPNNYQYKKGTFRIVKRNSVSYKLDLSDLIEWYIYFGFKEKSRINLLNQIHYGDIVFDIGANIGNVSFEAAKRCGVAGKVFAFEPDINNFTRLISNIELNQFKNIYPLNLGFGDKIASAKLYQVNENNSGMNRILDDNFNDNNFQEIKIRPLNVFVKENNINKLNIIKIDVEGFEMNVLIGAKQILLNYKPKLFIEIDENNLKINHSSPLEIINLLFSFGYTIYHGESMKKITSTYNFKNCHFDILAIVE